MATSLKKKGTPEIPLHKYFTKEVYEQSKKFLANGKAPGPNKIPNTIIKTYHLNSTTYYTTSSSNAINNAQYHNHGKQATPSYYLK
jgi:hypothetical protein